MIALAALLLGAAVPQTVPQTTPAPGPTPLPTGAPVGPGATTAPTAPATTAPTMTAPSTTEPATTMPGPPATAPPPTATPSLYHYRFVPHLPAHPAPGDPEIFAVYLNEKKLRSLGPIDIRVETNPEVVKVVSRSNGRDGVVPLVSPGVFVADGHLPKIPFIAQGMSLDLDFIATTADGRKVSVTVPVQVN